MISVVPDTLQTRALLEDYSHVPVDAQPAHVEAIVSFLTSSIVLRICASQPKDLLSIYSVRKLGTSARILASASVYTSYLS